MMRSENVPTTPSPEQPPLAPYDPPDPAPRAIRTLREKRQVAMAIALQTHVLKTCPLHNLVFCDDDVDPAGAFALAVELVRQHAAYVHEFHNGSHELTDLLSETIAASPCACPECGAPVGVSGDHWPRQVRDRDPPRWQTLPSG
jgi:fermentation-respiration switch protein FrsA (DUF1100 family)